MKRVYLIAAVVIAAGALAVVATAAQGRDAGSSAGSDDVYLDPDRLLELIQDPSSDFILVDVRTWDEYVSGHMPGAVHRDYREIGVNPPTDARDAFVVLYCRSGSRSNQALRTLERLGYTNVLDWGGILNWPHGVVVGAEPHAR